MSSARIRGSDYGRLTPRRRTKCLRFLAFLATAGSVLVSSLFFLHFALGPDQLASSQQGALEVTLLKSRTTTGSLGAERPSEAAPAEESMVQPAPEAQASEQKRRSRTKTSKAGSAVPSSDSWWPQFRAADYTAAEGTLGPH